MPYETIYKTGDAFVSWTVSFPTGKTWLSYAHIHIEVYDNAGTLLQTSGYPSGQGDNDLVVPDTAAGLCYMKLDSANIGDGCGALEWRLKAKEADAVFGDSFYNPEDRVIKFTLE